MIALRTLLVAVLLVPSHSFAWGKRGHETVGSLAAQLLAKEHKGAEFLLYHSFDMGYYNNVPDIIWKANDETYKKEFMQHFMDMEAFLKIKNIKWNKNRRDFFKKYADIKPNEGRALWRIQELYEENEKTAKQLQRKIADKKEQHDLQAKWIMTAGIMGHYVADLAQPLHVTENYDGQLTEQKGVHHWFEEEVVDQLYPDIKTDAFNSAKAQWAQFHKDNKNKPVFELVQQLVKSSQEKIPDVLKIDKEKGRSNAKDAAAAYKDLATARIAVGVLYLAEIWSRQTDWKYNGDRFYNFNAAPSYIEPQTEASF